MDRQTWGELCVSVTSADPPPDIIMVLIVTQSAETRAAEFPSFASETGKEEGNSSLLVTMTKQTGFEKRTKLRNYYLQTRGA